MLRSGKSWGVRTFRWTIENETSQRTIGGDAVSTLSQFLNSNRAGMRQLHYDRAALSLLPSDLFSVDISAHANRLQRSRLPTATPLHLPPDQDHGRSELPRGVPAKLAPVRKQHPDYWKQYRQAHPSSVERNRQQQRLRDRKQRVSSGMSSRRARSRPVLHSDRAHLDKLSLMRDNLPLRLFS